MAAFVMCVGAAHADTLPLKDGTTINNCFLRDEGSRVLVWETMADVGTPKSKVIPHGLVKDYKIERDASYDAHPNLPDLSVTFIEMTPRLQSLHAHIDYDRWGRPVPKGKGLPDIGESAYTNPEEVVKGLKLKYNPGEEITLTAHVKNVGFAGAKPFEYVWLIDGTEIGKGKHKKALKEMQEATFPIKWNWQEGQHTITFRIVTVQPEIAIINNEAADPLWGWGFAFYVSNGRVKAWHQARTAMGTFSFEDYYRWHVDMMNTLFAASVYPSAPEGIKARVRLDRIIYCDDLDEGARQLNGPDTIALCQGAWGWGGEDEKTKDWKPAEGRNSSEWSLPHELGHQLGFTDEYNLAYEGNAATDPVWPDNGEKVTCFFAHPNTMMHWHGAAVYSEICAGYLNKTWDKVRGYFGDYHFDIPKETFLAILDINGKPVADAKVEAFQNGTEVDPNGQPGEDHGVKYFPVIEDGNFDRLMSKDPVIVGTTDKDGIIRLPNRPVKEVTTLNGYHRGPNPWGNLNVAGNRCVMFVKVTKYDRPCFYAFTIYEFNVAALRGYRDKWTVDLKTPYRSADSPLPPRSVQMTKIDDTHVKVSWTEPDNSEVKTYLDDAIGFKVYRRIGSHCLNERPWFEAATLGPNGREFVIDLTERPEDVYWYTQTNRFAVSSLGQQSVESELVEAPLPPVKR